MRECSSHTMFMCAVSCVTCHLSCVPCSLANIKKKIILKLNLTKWWSLLMEGLLPKKPTQSSLKIVTHLFLDNFTPHPLMPLHSTSIKVSRFRHTLPEFITDRVRWKCYESFEISKYLLWRFFIVYLIESVLRKALWLSEYLQSIKTSKA